MNDTDLYRAAPEPLRLPAPILVYGATGHTGRFIVAALRARGITPLLAGRDAQQLDMLSALHGGLQTCTVRLDEAAALDAAVASSAAVINAAGPFAITATPLIEAAIRARRPYLDIAAEPDIVDATIRAHADAARAATVPLVTAAAFYGGLGDLLATAVMGDWTHADAITLAFALSSWKPTRGTRVTIDVAEARRGDARLVFRDNRLQLRNDAAAVSEYDFPPPVGRKAVVHEFTTGDSITIARHLAVDAIHEVMTLEPLQDLADTDHGAPEVVDDRGRSAQTFMIHATVQAGDAVRRGVVRGQDIYAVSAPLVVEALCRVLENPQPGVRTLGQLGDPSAFLRALAPEHLTFDCD